LEHNQTKSITVVNAIQGMKCLRTLKHWNRRFESHSRHGCLSESVLCCNVHLAACGGVILRPQESYRLQIQILETTDSSSANVRGCNISRKMKTKIMGILQEDHLHASVQAYCGMKTRCWATTSKQTARQSRC
jgi:hypothetical protein